MAVFPKRFPEIDVQLRPPVIPGPADALPEAEIYTRLAERDGARRAVARRSCRDRRARDRRRARDVPRDRDGTARRGRRARDQRRVAAHLLGLPSAWPSLSLSGPRRDVGAVPGERARRVATRSCAPSAASGKSADPFALGEEIFRRMLAHPEGVEIARLDPATNLDDHIGYADKKIRVAPEAMLDELERAIATAPLDDPDVSVRARERASDALDGEHDPARSRPGARGEGRTASSISRRRTRSGSASSRATWCVSRRGVARSSCRRRSTPSSPRATSGCRTDSECSYGNDGSTARRDRRRQLQRDHRHRRPRSVHRLPPSSPRAREADARRRRGLVSRPAGVRSVKLDVALFESDPRAAARRARALEAQGVDGVFTFDGPHDPFLPLVQAAAATERVDARHGGRDRVRPQSRCSARRSRTICRRRRRAASCSGSARRCARTSSGATARLGRARTRACASSSPPSVRSGAVGTRARRSISAASSTRTR